jgi:cobaltochelatase CobN
MNMSSFLKKNLKFFLSGLIGFLAIWYAASVALPTKIALINPPEFMYVKMVKSNDSRFISLKSFRAEEIPNLKSYDLVIVFGMGMTLTAEQESRLREAVDSGVPFYVMHAGGLTMETSNLAGKDLDRITDYVESGGTRNFRNLFYYVRKELDGKKLFAPDYAMPKKYAADLFFHVDEEAVFESVKDFENYCLANRFHKPGAKKVAIFTSVPGPFNANRDHLNSIIIELQNRSYNVYPASSFSKRLQFMQEIRPSLIVYMPHGRFGLGSDAEAIEKELVKQNVPVICPVSVMKRHDDWAKNPQGLSGGILSQLIAMPEFDGGIVPYAVVAQYEDENGLLLFRAIPDRLKNFGDIVDNFVRLQTLSNKDKKVSIVYYKGHGKGPGEAAGLEVAPSLYNTLKRLQAEGYTTGELPASAKEFEKDLHSKAPLLGTYAEGAFDAYLKTGYAELVSKEDYQKWVEESLPEELYQEVVKRYGAAPGSYMSVSRESGDYLAIAQARYGNIVIMPQPMPGLGDDGFALVHGAKAAPPHSYIAPYLWLQKRFKADAIMHFGTHGSLEFTPGKQVALSGHDWSDALIGTIPHFYPYISNDPGEAVIAKRRSYATMLSHVTPPFIESMVLSNQKILRDKVAQYERTTGNLREEYARSVKKLAITEGYAKDLGLDVRSEKPYTGEEMLKLINYLDEMDNERITAGLYTMGIPYEERHVASTVMLMSSNEIAYRLFELDKLKGLVGGEQVKNRNFFTTRYLQPAKSRVNGVYKSGGAETAFAQSVGKTDRAKAERWRSFTRFDEKKPDRPRERMLEKEDEINLEELIVKISAEPKQRAFIAKLTSEKEFDRAVSLLDPQKRARAKSMAKMIPAMREALEIAEESNIQKLISVMTNKELKVKALKLLSDPSLAERIRKQQLVRSRALVEKAESDTMRRVLELPEARFARMDVYALKKLEPTLRFYQKNRIELAALLGSRSSLSAKLSEVSLEKITSAFAKALAAKEASESAFSNAVFAVKDAYANIGRYGSQLLSTPESELDGIVNALNGRFVQPAPGGDPLNNPGILPTGRNIYAINAEQTPSKEAWAVGLKLVDQMLADFRKKNGKYPLKISYTLWSSEFIESEGATLAQILCLLGVEPVWDSFGRVNDIRLTSLAELKRPRIDVVVQTSGQLRDIAASRLYLIQKAINLVAAAEEDSKDENYVIEGVLAAKKRLLNQGFSPKEAEELSKTRVFGGINGSYGAGNFSSMVEKSDAWEKRSELAANYINNMGSAYGDENSWSSHNKGVFEAALLNTEAVVQPRQSNTWGPLSLDHVYEFMGGMNLAIREVTGNDAESYLSDYRNPLNPGMQGLKEGIWSEARTTLLNERYIREYMNGGASSAETFAETFRNTFAWNVAKPSVIENRLWDELYDTYVQDEKRLGVHDFFRKQNPYALQEMTAVMLETIRKGYWKASDKQVNTLVQLHVELVREHEAGCSGFVCDNAKLRRMIASKLSPDDAKRYSERIEEALSQPDRNKARVLKKEEKEKRQKSSENRIITRENSAWIAGLAVLIVLVPVIIYLRSKNRKK